MIETLIGTAAGFLLGLAAWGIQALLTNRSLEETAKMLIIAEVREHLDSVSDMWGKITSDEQEDVTKRSIDRCYAFACYPLSAFADHAFRGFAPSLGSKRRHELLPALCKFHRLLGSLTELRRHLRDLWEEQQGNLRIASGGTTQVTYRTGEGEPMMPFDVHGKFNAGRLEELVDRITTHGRETIEMQNKASNATSEPAPGAASSAHQG